jgi:formylglycine-generating enzyme required for sulfatase activity
MEKVFNKEDFVLIKAGKFAMGDDQLGDTGDGKYFRRHHYVVLTRSFKICKYHVVQAKYEYVMGTNPSKFLEDDRPVECLNWQEAIEFCNKASLLDGFTPAYVINKFNDFFDSEDSMGTWKIYWWNQEANGYRLPTEAEWEYACRAGITGIGKDIDYDEVGWYKYNSDGETHPVGQLEPNNWGLYDMMGNVYEHCWDCYEPEYHYENLQTDPGVEASPYDRKRVMRGGSYNSNEEDLYFSSRSYSDTGSIHNKVYSHQGFRVVCTVPTQGSGPSVEEWKAEETRIIEETKSKWKKKGGCFITTAVCNNSGKPDDCYELTSFRQFRDGWLAKQPDGKELIDEYYKIAPLIVENINKSEKKESIYTAIWERCLLNCLRLIEEKQFHECKKEYMRMVDELKSVFL